VQKSQADRRCVEWGHGGRGIVIDASDLFCTPAIGKVENNKGEGGEIRGDAGTLERRGKGGRPRLPFDVSPRL